MTRWPGGARRHWPLVVILAELLGAALIVGLGTPVATGDDWLYVRTAQALVRDHHLSVPGLSVASLVAHTVWQAAFASLFGTTFGVLRVSTFMLFAIGGVALYALVHEVTRRRDRSALATAAYLFSPLAFILACTSMTDVPFCTWLIVSTALYVRGLNRTRPRTGIVLAASAIASVAFLVRQQGLLIALAVAAVVFVTVPRERGRVPLVAAATVFPLLTAVGYVAFITFVNGVPGTQQEFVGDVRAAGVGGTAAVLAAVAFLEAAYAGIFALPVVIAGLPTVFRRAAPARWRVIFVGLWAAVLAGGTLVFSLQARVMPYAGQWVRGAGLGPDDLRAGREWIVPLAGTIGLTAVTIAASIGLAVLISRLWPRAGIATKLVAAVAVGQAVGAAPASFHFRAFSPEGVPTLTLDRYLLPLLPLVLCLAAAAIGDRRGWMAGGWLATAAFAFVAVAGTRDYFAFQGTVWRVARTAVRAGVDERHLDAGAAWDGWHLSTGRYPPPSKPVERHPPWWIDLFAPQIDSTYAVAASPHVPGYSVVGEEPVTTILGGRPQRIYLLRRDRPAQSVTNVTHRDSSM